MAKFLNKKANSIVFNQTQMVLPDVVPKTEPIYVRLIERDKEIVAALAFFFNGWPILGATQLQFRVCYSGT